jgi:hypothetical protein
MWRRARRLIASELILGISELSKTDRVYSEIEHSLYICSVDLWSEDGTKEVNLICQTTPTPIISSTAPASFTELDRSTRGYASMFPSHRDPSPSGYTSTLPYSHQSANPGTSINVTPYGIQSPAMLLPAAIHSQACQPGAHQRTSESQ